MYEMPVRVSASLVGPDRLCTTVALLGMLQDCSLFWFENESVATSWLRDEGLAPVLTSRQVDIVRRPRYGERLKVRTGVYSFRGFLGYRNTWIYDELDEPVVKCWCMGAFIDLASGKMARVPAPVASGVTVDGQLPMEYLGHKITLPACEARVLNPVEVRPTDIDLNRHVNNAQYVRMACDILPELAATCTRLRMEYRGQARLGDALTPAVYETPDGRGAVVVLDRQDGSTCAMVEMG